MKLHSTYKGCQIFIKGDFGYRLKWTSYCWHTGMFISADTLRGIKNLISDMDKERIKCISIGQ
jgi:hypothetical protein